MTMSTPPPSGGQAGPDLASISSPEGSPARGTPSPASSSEPRMNGGDGPRSARSSTPSRRRSSSSRTSRTSLVPVSSMSSETLPTVGSMRGGFVSPQLPLVRRICAGDSSQLPPTPSASSYGTNQGGAARRVGPVRPSLASMARHGLWPTPQATMGERGGRGDLHFAVTRGRTSRSRDWTDVAPESGWQVPTGLLNPEFVEWCMGLPSGWTSIPTRPDSGPSETP